VERRDLLRTLGAAAALSFVPREAHAVWSRVAALAAARQTAGGLSGRQLALVGAIADTVLPRTDTPGATDVGVPAFVDVIVAEYYADDERAAFLAGLDAVDAHVRAAQGAPFAELPERVRAVAVESLERAGDRRAEPARTWWRLKGLIVHGYFTSERAQQEVLRVNPMPGRFDGAAPHPARAGRS